MFDYAPIAQGFQAAREHLGMTRYAVAKRAGVPVTTIIRLEREDARPTLDMLATVAEALGCTMRVVIKPVPGADVAIRIDRELG